MTSQVNHYTNDRSTGTNGESSDEIRENIEQTRRRMGSKIDQIQERLDPRNLRDQTQEVVRNVVADSTDAMMDYVRENTRELGSSLVSALKRHPLPAAMIGLGLVWLMAENMGGSSDDSDEWSRQRGYGRSYDRSRPESRYYNYERAAYDPNYRGDYGSGSYSGQYGSGQYGSGQYSQGYSQSYGSGYSGSTQGNSQSYDQRQDGSSMKDKALDAVSGAAENVRETAKEWGQEVSETAREWRHEVGEKASEFRGEIRERMSGMGQDAQWRAQQMGRQAGYRARRVSEDNPLMTGAVAFAIGAAAGLLLPPTRKESEWMGEARERFMQSARQTADEVVHRAEEVVQEVRPTVEQAARDIGDSVKRTGQEAADRVREAAAETKSKVEHEVKHEMDKADDKAGDMSATGTMEAAGSNQPSS